MDWPVFPPPQDGWSVLPQNGQAILHPLPHPSKQPVHFNPKRIFWYKISAHNFQIQHYGLLHKGLFCERSTTVMKHDSVFWGGCYVRTLIATLIKQNSQYLCINKWKTLKFNLFTETINFISNHLYGEQIPVWTMCSSHSNMRKAYSHGTFMNNLWDLRNMSDTISEILCMKRSW